MPVNNVVSYLRTVDRVLATWTAERIKSLPGFPPDRVDYQELSQTAWFRGHADSSWKLIPRAYRVERYDPRREIEMNMNCRRTAGALPGAPPRHNVAAWLCFMQHHGLPTRLLDWTGIPLAALYFAVESHAEDPGLYQHRRSRPCVWMLNPHALNWLSVGASIVPGTGEDERAGNERDGWTIRFGWANILPAFGATLLNERDQPVSYETPMAIVPDYTHPRMQVQKSRFTAHSVRRESLHDIFRDTPDGDSFLRGFLVRIDITRTTAERIYLELSRLGISRSVLFPEVEGLSREASVAYDMGSKPPSTGP